MITLEYSDFEDLAKFSPHGKLPDKKTDAEGWNATWNRYLEWKFHPTIPSDSKVTQETLASFFTICENPLTRQAYFAQSRDVATALLKLQVGITKFIGRRWESFALGWLNLASKHRLEHILRALVRLCDAFDHEESRLLCPESTNAFLERDSGRGFLDLITTFSPPQSNTKTQAKQDEPTILFNAQFERVMGFDQPCPVGRDPAVWDVARNSRQYARSEFLCHMIFYIFQTACNREIPSPYLLKVGGGKKEYRGFCSRLPDSVNSIDGFKESFLDPHKAMQRVAVWACTTCGRSEVDLPLGTPIVFCVRCRALDRRVPYCNKECQTRDWKFGDPPHKTICGKPVSAPSPSPAVHLSSFDQVTSSSRKDIFGVPPPDKGFIRSRALASTIANLQYEFDTRLNREVLTYILKAGDGKAIGLSTDRYTWIAAYFRVFRNHAFRNGDPKAVAVMYKCLSQEVRRDIFPLHLILFQLCREFEIEPKRLTELARDIPVRELSKRDRDKVLAEIEYILTPD